MRKCKKSNSRNMFKWNYYRCNMKFVILGEPKAKGRPRFTSNGHAYTPQGTVEYENLVKISYQSQTHSTELMEGELKATITAFFSIPKSTSKKKKKLMLEGLIDPVKKPDCDNLAKTVLDALNTIAYKDDSRITELHVEKHYSETPRVEVEIEVINHE